MRTLAILLAVTATACASAPSPIQLRGSPGALSQLAGNWSGSYSSPDSRRHGGISFSLRAGDTVAYGEVLMIPREYENHQVWTERNRHAEAERKHPAVLPIMFVGVSSDRVTGMLEPYTDPDCDCLVVTTFVGRLVKANTLEGTFITRIPGTTEARRGEWKVTRKAM